MKYNGTRHISQDFYTEMGLVSSNQFENTSLKSISLNKNKFYKIKNLNIINSNNVNLANSASNSASILINNDTDFLNNMYLAYLATYGVPVSFEYLDANGASFTTYPLPFSSTLDIESMRSRFSNRISYNLIKVVHAKNNIWQNVFSSLNYFSGLLRVIPITNSSNSFGVIKYSYSNYITDFSFYNNLSNKLNILTYMDQIEDANSPNFGAFGIDGTIDFDLEEYEIE